MEARLNREAYAYLLAFRPDGVVELCFPEDEGEQPERTDHPRYPSKSRRVRYGLTDGAGLWVFAVVAADKPLPAHREWIGRRTPSWDGKAQVKPGSVWIDDGQWVDTLTAAGVNRGDRGKGVTVPGSECRPTSAVR